MATIGRHDRRVKIQVRVLTKDDAAGMVESWLDVCSSWAEKVDERGKQSEVADSDRADNQAMWRIRYKSFLQGASAASGYRLTYKNEVFDILHAKEEGRKNTMLLTTLTTEGIV